MKTIKTGDVFEIETHKGKAYLQYVFENNNIGQLVRVLRGLYSKIPEDIEKVVMSEELFLVHFPVKAAFNRKILTLVGNFPLPKNFKIPNYFRSDFRDNEGNLLYWHLIDYTTWKRRKIDNLDVDQKKLSPWGVWNDTLLIEKLENGWNLDKWS